MADLSETPLEFPDGVYQLERTDRALGGAPNGQPGVGTLNIPNQQLSKRTRWLKAALDTLQAAFNAHRHDNLYLGINARAKDAERLGNVPANGYTQKSVFDAHHHDAQYLGLTARAKDAERLGNVPAADYTLKSAFDAHRHDNLYLGRTERAADAAKLGAVPAADYARKSALTASQSKVHSETGRQSFGGGLHDKWGRVGFLSHEDYIAFPEQFPTACFGVLVVDLNQDAGPTTADIISVVETFRGGFRVSIVNDGVPVTTADRGIFYMARGN